jgi:predicted ATP-dependent serine protease
MWFGYVEPSIVILFQTNIRINRIKQTKRKIYLWKSTNMDELCTEVQTKLNDFMAVSFLTIDNMWIAFKDILLNAIFYVLFA